jgi:hypothetical protein
VISHDAVDSRRPYPYLLYPRPKDGTAVEPPLRSAGAQKFHSCTSPGIEGILSAADEDVCGLRAEQLAITMRSVPVRLFLPLRQMLARNPGDASVHGG